MMVLLGLTATVDAASKTVALGGKVQVDFPSQPMTEARTVETKFGPIKLESFKARVPGVFLNLLVVTYPAQVIRAQKDPVAFIERTATGHEKQKTGAERIYFKELVKSEQWAAEHRFTYPSGKKSTGERYAKGFALYRYYLVDSSMVTVFVDVLDGTYKARTKEIDERIEDFFSSVQISER